MSAGEDLLAKQLEYAGYIYEREYPFARPMRKWRSDFYIKCKNLLIEVEGISYRGAGLGHQLGNAYQLNCEKYNHATLMGFSLFRFTIAQIKGTASRGKGKSRVKMDKAIDIIDQFIIGKTKYEVDKTKNNYAVPYINKD